MSIASNLKTKIVLIQWHPHIKRYYCQIDMADVRVDGSNTPRMLIEDHIDPETLKSIVTDRLRNFEVIPQFIDCFKQI